MTTLDRRNSTDRRSGEERRSHVRTGGRIEPYDRRTADRRYDVGGCITPRIKRNRFRALLRRWWREVTRGPSIP